MVVLMVDMISEMGGAQHSLYELCTTLSKYDVKMVAAVPYGPLFDQLTAAKVEVYPLAQIRARKRGWGLFTSAAKLARAPASLAQIVKTVKPDIIHCNHLTALLAARNLCKHYPVIWHVRDLNLPISIARDASRKVARIFAISEAVDEYLVEILSQRNLGRIRVVRNGINPEPFLTVSRELARSQLGLPPNVPVVGMIAHLTPWKRHDAFIEAAQTIAQRKPESHFVIVGRDLFKENTRYRNRLAAAVTAAGLTSHFHWVTDVDEVEKILPAFDVLLHPALREPFGRVICEAMAANVPVIAAESGGPASLIQQNETGILIRDGDAQHMAAQTIALLDEPERRRIITAKAHCFVLENHTTTRMCEQTACEYRELLAALATQPDNNDD